MIIIQICHYDSVICFSFGRKIALCGCITAVFISNLVLIFAPNFLAFTVFRFFNGLGAIGCWNTAFVIGTNFILLSIFCIMTIEKFVDNDCATELRVFKHFK